MKLKIRGNNFTEIITIENDLVTLKQLKDILLTQFQPELAAKYKIESEGLLLSLNGKDALSDDSKSLKDLDIVAGDILRILNQSKDNNSVKRVKQEPPSASSPATQTTQKTVNSTPKVYCPSSSAASTSHSTRKDVKESPLDVSVNNVLSHLLQQCADSNQLVKKTDALVLVLHSFMIETGFTLPDLTNVSNKFRIPDGWKSNPHFYSIEYFHPQCPERFINLKLVPMGPKLVVTALVTEPHVTVSICLKIDDYVNQVDTDVQRCFRSLPKLNRVFKDEVCYPVIARVRNALGLRSLQGLSALFYELLLKTFSYLDVISVIRCSVLCRDFYQICQDQNLWRSLYLRDFGSAGQGTSPAQDWQKMYRDKVIARREEQRIRQQHQEAIQHLHNSLVHPRNPFMPDVPMFPGIVGGDYDRNPFADPFGVPFPPLRPHMPRPSIDPFQPFSPLRPRPSMDPFQPGRPRPGPGSFFPRFL